MGERLMVDGISKQKIQNFSCYREKLKIQGMLYFPEHFTEDNKYPVAIISHGFTGHYLNNEEYCSEFARMGYVACTFSFCGGGALEDSDSLKSDGDTTDMTILTEVEDLLSVKNYMMSQPYADRNELILVGISQGGFVSGLAASRCGSEIKKLIMIYPALCIPEHARRGCLAGSSYDPTDVPDRIDCGRTVLGKQFHETVVGMDPYLELTNYKGPVLILHGLEDSVVNYSYSVRAKESYGRQQCHLQLIREVGHWMNETQFPSAMGSIRQFLLDKVGILTIRVVITHIDSVREDDNETYHIYFTGYCDTKYFQGAIVPEGCDTQVYHKGKLKNIRAEYTLKGSDSDGKSCSIHIVNQKGKIDWSPIIKTDSLALNWLNNSQLSAILEGSSNGPTVRIFCDRK